jgi:hypothetical protein
MCSSEGDAMLNHDGYGVEIGFSEGPVAGDIGEDEAANTDGEHFIHEVNGVDVGGLSPPADGDFPIVGVEADNDTIGTVFLDGLLDHVGVGDRSGSEDDAIYASREGNIDVLYAAEASTDFKRDAYVASERTVKVALLGPASESAVEVNDVDADGTSVDELTGDLERVVRKGCLAVEVALVEAYDLALSEVNSGNNVHWITRG